ncbi:MAG: hypothetical protein VKO21_07745 [Candidatus Sericytochromatia bacterium]|nr:hypothetical protein [Candidatus Sericytochromatia bacterium]
MKAGSGGADRISPSNAPVAAGFLVGAFPLRVRYFDEDEFSL